MTDVYFTEHAQSQLTGSMQSPANNRIVGSLINRLADDDAMLERRPMHGPFPNDGKYFEVRDGDWSIVYTIDSDATPPYVLILSVVNRGRLRIDPKKALANDAMTSITTTVSSTAGFIKSPT